MIGDLIDHYRVLELVGRGAMGVVYKALDLNLDRPVAIKVMSAEARNDPDFVERFRQEARMQGALNHPNVALLFDYFVHDGAPVAVMEFIDGESLEQLIRRRGAIPAHESIPIFKQALRGVAAAHRAGIIHRDLKTANLMITRDDVVKVMDFGIAKRQGVDGRNQGQHQHRQPTLHGARADPRSRCRLPHRRVRPRGHALPALERAAAVQSPRQDRVQCLERPCERSAGAADGLLSRYSAADRGRRDALDREGARGALPERG